MQMQRQDWAATALVAMALAVAGCGGEDGGTGPGRESVPEVPDHAEATVSGMVLSFTPEADTYIYSQSPSTNFGTALDLAVGGSPNQRIAYLRFNVSGLPTGAQVTDARLAMLASNGSTQGGGAIRKYAPTSSSWAETGPTWNNPLAGSDASSDLFVMGPVSSGSTYTFTGLTSSVTGNGRVTFVIRSTGSDGAAYRSREYGTSSQRPLLKVTFTAPSSVERYGIFEKQITNSKSYSNRFDFNVIELRGTFTAPSGKAHAYFGFFDGNGLGGQTGNVWKVRYRPDEVGTWQYQYSWSDGTPGGSGSFQVVDNGRYRGPLSTDPSTPWFFQDARGQNFNFRGYGMQFMALWTATQSFLQEASCVSDVLQTRAIAHGYNFVMLTSLDDRVGKGPVSWKESWWLNTTNTKVFNLPVWQKYEALLDQAKNNGVYVIQFAAMIRQGDQYAFNDFKVFLRYWVARFGAYYNFMGWSPTWEWPEIWTAADVNQIMTYAQSINPFPTMLSVHDCSDSHFAGWLDFSMRGAGGSSIFKNNNRLSGDQLAGCDAVGGVGTFVNQPIVGAEDAWEYPQGGFGKPTNATEVRRTVWGDMMAGVMPIYSEWNSQIGGTGTGEPEARRMFDFLYKNTNYRSYKQLNSLVSAGAGQIASGIAGSQYLVYDQNGGPITVNLSGASSSKTFAVLWYNPATGASTSGATVQGGGSRTFSPPSSLFGATSDEVLLLK